jgi:hypothetical protein
MPGRLTDANGLSPKMSILTASGFEDAGVVMGVGSLDAAGTSNMFMPRPYAGAAETLRPRTKVAGVAEGTEAALGSAPNTSSSPKLTLPRVRGGSC